VTRITIHSCTTKLTQLFADHNVVEYPDFDQLLLQAGGDGAIGCAGRRFTLKLAV